MRSACRFPSAVEARPRSSRCMGPGNPRSDGATAGDNADGGDALPPTPGSTPTAVSSWGSADTAGDSSGSKSLRTPGAAGGSGASQGGASTAAAAPTRGGAAPLDAPPQRRDRSDDERRRSPPSPLPSPARRGAAAADAAPPPCVGWGEGARTPRPAAVGRNACAGGSAVSAAESRSWETLPLLLMRVSDSTAETSGGELADGPSAPEPPWEGPPTPVADSPPTAPGPPAAVDPPSPRLWSAAK